MLEPFHALPFLLSPLLQFDVLRKIHKAWLRYAFYTHGHFILIVLKWYYLKDTR